MQTQHGHDEDNENHHADDDETMLIIMMSLSFGFRVYIHSARPDQAEIASSYIHTYTSGPAFVCAK